jgi:nucleoside-triphosphatase THEP1
MKIAAVLYDGGAGPQTDELIAELARGLRCAGFKLAGAVQSNVAIPGRSRCDIVLEDLATGRTTKTSQDHGPLARGCRLDSGALEESVGLASSSLGTETDLVIINRFGKQEAEGHGFRPMIEQAVLLGVPVIVGLNRTNLESWRAFVGGEAELLPPELCAVSSWCTANVSERSSGDGLPRCASVALT